MHVFVTGGTGTIGAPVVAELLAHGHSVLALARSDRSARALETAGAETLRGELADLDVLRSGVAKADGVVHVAFGHADATPDGLARAMDEETAVLAALGAELVGTDRPIVTASGTPWVAGKVATESDPWTPADRSARGPGR